MKKGEVVESIPFEWVLAIRVDYEKKNSNGGECSLSRSFTHALYSLQ